MSAEPIDKASEIGWDDDEASFDEKLKQISKTGTRQSTKTKKGSSHTSD